MTHLTLSARSRQGSGRLADTLFRGSSRIAAGVVVALLLFIALLLYLNSRLTWETFGLSFITGQTWDPVKGIYGALPFIFGTVLAALIAVILAAPVGIFTAIYLSELAPRRLATPLTFTIELLAAIPSVVIGLWGVFVLAPFLRGTVESWIVSTVGWIPFLGGPAYGVGLFSAGVILTIMILPTIVTISREVIQAVPGSQREAMFALGATRWEVIRRAVVPFARSGIIGAVILGLGRALGETMAVTMVIGNRDAIPKGLFDQTQTIASKIATSFSEAQVGIETSSLIALGLVLLVMTVIMNVIARLLVWRVAGPVAGE
ncbi:MAG TPA: phosphate ABC transporter permease subunit PstC [Candidatus Limnocylindrales bacterium]|jgi:phosphate transport system permease protein|nr:phosphate ABC transporter permease subunit PstC [Candidatus Limnocylindrales bacterium]